MCILHKIITSQPSHLRKMTSDGGLILQAGVRNVTCFLFWFGFFFLRKMFSFSPFLFGQVCATEVVRVVFSSSLGLSSR